MSRDIESRGREYGRGLDVVSDTISRISSSEPSSINTISDSTLGQNKCKKCMTQVIKGYGTFNSTGVTPDGSTSELIGEQAEVEFTINVYNEDRNYEGEVYIVCYDTRKKINSNQLMLYQEIEDEEIICIFCINYPNGCKTCSYELIVSMRPTNCSTHSKGEFYAYSAPIYNSGVNIGGALETGEIDLSRRESNCGCC